MHLWIGATPLVVLTVVLLFRFIGCTSTATGTGGSFFKLNLDPDIQKPMPPGDSRQVKQVRVRWSIWNGGSLLRSVPPTGPDEINPKDPPFLDPTSDPGAEYLATPADLMTANLVSCTCELTLGTSLDTSLDTNVTVHSTPFALSPTDSSYVFTLTPKPNKVTGSRDFVLREYSV